MYCKKCGQKIADGAKFCKFCGASTIQQEDAKVEQNNVCVTCGKELSEVAKFCKFCGASISKQNEYADIHKAESADINSLNSEHQKPEKQSDAVEPIYTNQQETVCPSVAVETSSTNSVQFPAQLSSEVPGTALQKQKNISKRGKIIIISSAAFLLIAIILCFIIDGDGTNSMIVETGKDDYFGGVAFDLTLNEFIENYNYCIDETEEYDIVRQDMYLVSDNFEKQDCLLEGFHLYYYRFGYTSNNQFNTMARITFMVNDNTQRINTIEYIYRIGGYNSDDAEINYWCKLPSRIFSLFDSNIIYEKDNYSSYMDLLKKVVDKTHYYKSGILYTALSNEEDASFSLNACTEASQCYDDFTGLNTLPVN